VTGAEGGGTGSVDAPVLVGLAGGTHAHGPMGGGGYVHTAQI
jgi:hypothetical protein